VSKDSLAEAADNAPESDGSRGLNLSQFRGSRWFTRGWTLQELIAPRNLVFYSREWSFLGTKASFASDISSITGIETRHFTVTVLDASVATRMSWLAKRQTTRIEDMAYCMLGIFDINMPLLYGEGPKAFLRLQEEIIRVNDDQSIFAWNIVADKIPQSLFSDNKTIGFLATTPSAFECARPAVPSRLTAVPSPYAMTNAGLSITLPLVPTANGYIVILNASRPGDHARLGIYIRGNGVCVGEVMSRVISPARPLRVCLDPSKFKSTRIYLRAADRRTKNPLRFPVSSPPRNRHGLLVSLRQCMERRAPKFYTLPEGSLQCDTLVFPAAHDHPNFVVSDEAYGVRVVTTGVVLGATHSSMDEVLDMRLSCSVLLTQTTAYNLETNDVDYHHAALALGNLSPDSRLRRLPFATIQEMETAASNMIREENAFVLSKYVHVKRDTRTIVYAMVFGRGCAYRFEGGCRDYVEFGCCDMDFPDFDHLRLVQIGWPPEPGTGEMTTPMSAEEEPRSPRSGIPASQVPGRGSCSALVIQSAEETACVTSF